MDEERIRESALQDEVLRGQVMKTPDDVAAMLRLKSLGWGAKRIARELGCSHHTVKGYVAAGGVKPFKSPERPKLLDGHEDWLRERFIRHRGNADARPRMRVGLAPNPATRHPDVQARVSRTP